MDCFEPSLLATDAAERARFLEALRATGSVMAACRATGTSRTTVHRQRRRDRAFAAAWDAAIGRSEIDALEAALIARATHGVERYRFYANGRVDLWLEFDNRLAVRLLESLKRDPFGDPRLAPPPPPAPAMTRAEFMAAIEARPRTVDLVALDDGIV